MSLQFIIGGLMIFYFLKLLKFMATRGEIILTKIQVILDRDLIEEKSEEQLTGYARRKNNDKQIKT